MRTVALVSGGKDSCFNMMQCMAAGHSIVALANLHPVGKDDLDSYMYQTVGHEVLGHYGEAMEIPLYRQSTCGKALNTGKDYKPTDDDEVEDLFILLERIKNEMQIEAVASGAILSDYQRIRVENVCSRLGLVSLAYLWRRNQINLLQEMIDSGLHAIIIKVAALGLDPKKHLGMSLSEIKPHLLKMHEKYGLNVCGEGGEYETFTLDCPMFKKKLVVDETSVVIQSEDPVATTGYLYLTKVHLEDKNKISELPKAFKTTNDFLNETNDTNFSNTSQIELRDIVLTEQMDANEDQLDDADEIFVVEERRKSDDEKFDQHDKHRLGSAASIGLSPFEHSLVDDQTITGDGRICGNDAGWYFVGGVVGTGDFVECSTQDGLNKLYKHLESFSLGLKDVCSINMYIRDMSQYPIINGVYNRYFDFATPPTRVCIQCPFSEGVHIIFDAVAYKKKINNDSEEQKSRKTMMHVQSISHWAPANIGPYSQAFKVGDLVGTSGQIGLVPSTMEMLDSGIKEQCSLTLRHLGRVLNAIDSKTDIRSILQGFCYTRVENVWSCQRQLEKRTAGALVEYIVVSNLPRDASVEWQAIGHHNSAQLDYEETGCNVGSYKVSIKRRWNFENTVSAFVCHVATSSSPSSSLLTFQSEDAYHQHISLANNMSVEEIKEIIMFCIKKVMNQADTVRPAISIRVFYQVGASPKVERIQLAIQESSELCQVETASSVLPAVGLHNHFTFLSITGLCLRE